MVAPGKFENSEKEKRYGNSHISDTNAHVEKKKVDCSLISCGFYSFVVEWRFILIKTK